MTLMEHLTRIVVMLRAAIGTQLTRQLRPPQPVWLGQRVFLPLIPAPKRPLLPEPVWTLLWLRLDRLRIRLHALHEKWRTGTLPKPHTPRSSTLRPQRPKPEVRLPRAFAWVNHRIPEAAPPAGFLSHILYNETEARRFVAEAPQAGRLLRPLCQALGVPQPDWLKLPPRPRKPRPQKPRPERPWRLTDPRLGLQPYVIAAARAAKKSDRA